MTEPEEALAAGHAGIAAHTEGELGRLPALINEEHRLCQVALAVGFEHAIRAGALLIEAKVLCPHGCWLGWLAENFEGSERTAQGYMRVARNWPALKDGNPKHVADLSYREAQRLLAEPRDGLAYDRWLLTHTAVLQAEATPALQDLESRYEAVEESASPEALTALMGIVAEAGWWQNRLAESKLRVQRRAGQLVGARR